RQLHIEPSIEVSDYQSGPVTPQRSDPQASGWQELVRCEKFVLQALESGTAVAGGDDQFHILTVPQGTATIESSGETIKLQTGDSVLLPAALDRVELLVDSKSTLLEMHLP
ncbi:MAG: class I mannose-6-phosphate isomerase, partial [Pirellulaceae bacterium]|nr:class I mannose-6-phosphate isomerase [Pirellulaceae bacterium]